MTIIKYLIVVVLLAGCSRANRDQTFKVNGDVKLDGQPLTSGTVVFMPEKGRAAKGAIDTNGSFKLGTYMADDGAAAGRYQVMVIAPDHKAIQGGAVNLDQHIPSLVPERYTSTTTSGLAFEVKPTEANVAHFTLTSKATP
jgi:hypothetical protein